MTDSQPQPSLIERNGIRTTRDHRPPLPGGSTDDRITLRVTATGAAITMTIAQAHEAIDQLALLMHRPDLIERHRHQPQRRDQPERRT